MLMVGELPNYGTPLRHISCGRAKQWSGHFVRITHDSGQIFEKVRVFLHLLELHTLPIRIGRGLDLSRCDAAPLIAFTATKEMNYGTETDGRIWPRCGAYRTDERANAKQVADDLGVGMSTLNKWMTPSIETRTWCQKRILASLKRMTCILSG
mgnify:CR=1 FL=1